jgi:DEAD/DEAH box helicase domain-containing protein
VTILETFESAETTSPSTTGTSEEPESLADAALVSGASASAFASTSESASGSHGEVHVVSRVVGFKKIRFYTNENVGSGELDLPEQQMHTTSYWLTIPSSVMGALPYASDDRRDGVVGLSFAMRQIAQLLLMSDSHDIGISIHSDHEAGRAGGAGTAGTGANRIFIYDNYPGGIGFSQPLFRMHRELLDATRRLISECECESGCPGCVGPVGNTGPLAKAVALRILDLLLERALVGRTA